MDDPDLEVLKASRREARAQRRRRRGSRRPPRPLVRDASALVALPGPPGWSAEQREAACAALDRCGEGAGTTLEEQHDAWCADVVARAERARAAGVSVSESDLGVCAEDWASVVAGADRHRERTDRVELLTAWLAAAPEPERAAFERARRERRQVREGQDHLAALRSGLGAVGRVHAAQLERVAAMAALYRSVEQPGGRSQDDDEGRAPDGATSRQRAQRGQEELAEGLDALLVEVATSLGWTQTSARSVIATALLATTAMPRAMALLRGGGLQLAQLQVVVERLCEAEAAVAEQVDEVLFGEGGSGVGLTTAELRHEADAVLHRLDAAAVGARARRRVRSRDVVFRMLGDGIGELRFTGPAPALAAVHARLTGVARADLADARAVGREGRPAACGPDPYADPLADRDPVTGLLPDERGVGAHRFDAGVGSLLGVQPASTAGRGAAWVGPTIEVHVSLPGAVGVDDLPGHLEGYGWVPGFLVRQCLTWQGCRLRRVLTDPFTGDLITTDGHTYPASWLTDPGPDPGLGPGPATGPPGGGPRGGGGSPGLFRGLPVQHLPPPRTEDDVLDAPLDETDLFDLADRPDDGDPCRDGTCRPLDPRDCPAPDGPHRPPAALDRWVRRAWGRCTGPGSTAGAADGDLDHVVPWREDGSGGTTCSCNLEPKSRRFHLLKHGTDRETWRNDDDPAAVPWTRRWQQHRCTEGSSHWRSPLGADHVVRPRRPALPVPRFRAGSWPPAPPAAAPVPARPRLDRELADTFPDEPAF